MPELYFLQVCQKYQQKNQENIPRITDRLVESGLPSSVQYLPQSLIKTCNVPLESPYQENEHLKVDLDRLCWPGEGCGRGYFFRVHNLNETGGCSRAQGEGVQGWVQNILQDSRMKKRPQRWRMNSGKLTKIRRWKRKTWIRQRNIGEKKTLSITGQGSSQTSWRAAQRRCCKTEQVEDADNRLEERERRSGETVSEAEVENWRTWRWK